MRFLLSVKATTTTPAFPGLITSLGALFRLAFNIALAQRISCMSPLHALNAGIISAAIFTNNFALYASSFPLRCLMSAHFECPEKFRLAKIACPEKYPPRARNIATQSTAKKCDKLHFQSTGSRCRQTAELFSVGLVGLAFFLELLFAQRPYQRAYESVLKSRADIATRRDPL